MLRSSNPLFNTDLRTESSTSKPHSSRNKIIYELYTRRVVAASDANEWLANKLDEEDLANIKTEAI